MTRDHQAIRAAVDQLAREGVTVTVRVDALPDPGGQAASDHLFVHVVATRLTAPATWMAVHCAFHAHCPHLPVHHT